MKVQCPSCREIVSMEEFETSSAGLSFVCPLCRASNFLANPRAEQDPASRTKEHADGAPPDHKPADAGQPAGDTVPADATAEEILCPKCGHAQHDRYACHSCGLVFERFDPARLPPDPLEARQLWEQIERHPADDELHDRFVQACMQIERLDYATRQYRFLARQSVNQEVAQRMLARVAEVGQARLPVSGLDHDQTREQGKTLRTVLWIIVLLGLGALAYAVIQSTTN